MIIIGFKMHRFPQSNFADSVCTIEHIHRELLCHGFIYVGPHAAAEL